MRFDWTKTEHDGWKLDTTSGAVSATVTYEAASDDYLTKVVVDGVGVSYGREPTLAQAEARCEYVLFKMLDKLDVPEPKAPKEDA